MKTEFKAVAVAHRTIECALQVNTAVSVFTSMVPFCKPSSLEAEQEKQKFRVSLGHLNFVSKEK